MTGIVGNILVESISTSVLMVMSNKGTLPSGGWR